MFDLYGRDNCVWCDRAKKLLQDEGLPVRYHSIEQNKDDLRDFKRLFPGAKTVPQITHSDMGGTYTIGGYDNLVKYLENEW